MLKRFLSKFANLHESDSKFLPFKFQNTPQSKIFSLKLYVHERLNSFSLRSARGHRPAK